VPPAKLANKVVWMAKHHYHTTTLSFYIFEIEGFGLREEERSVGFTGYSIISLIIFFSLYF
jgi:hypothetical protein